MLNTLLVQKEKEKKEEVIYYQGTSKMGKHLPMVIMGWLIICCRIVVCQSMDQAVKLRMRNLSAILEKCINLSIIVRFNLLAWIVDRSLI